MAKGEGSLGDLSSRFLLSFSVRWECQQITFADSSMKNVWKCSSYTVHQHRHDGSYPLSATPHPVPSAPPLLSATRSTSCIYLLPVPSINVYANPPSSFSKPGKSRCEKRRGQQTERREDIRKPRARTHHSLTEPRVQSTDLQEMGSSR